jgi:hypothetical protein
MKTTPARKTEGLFGDRATGLAHQRFRNLERIHLDYRQWCARRFVDIRLQAKIDVARHGASIGWAEIRHQKVKSLGVKGFGGSGRTHRQFNEAYSFWHERLPSSMGVMATGPQIQATR